MNIQIRYKLYLTSLKWPVSYIFKGCSCLAIMCACYCKPKVQYYNEHSKYIIMSTVSLEVTLVLML